MLLLADVAGTLVVALLSADRPNLMRILARGAMISLAFYVVFDVAEAFWFIGRGPEIWRLGSLSARFDNLQNAGELPRLAGPVADGNRGGFVLLFYIAVMALGERRVGLRRTMLGVAVLLFVFTLSRSAALAATAMGVMAFVSRSRGVTVRAALTACCIAVTAASLLIVRPDTFDRISAVLQSPIAKRLSTSEGSAQSHLTLIGRGIDVATQTVPNTVIGLGYGNSYLVLQDVFPGNKYGNFHSLYVTMFAEAGILALVLTLVLMGTPLLLGGPWRALVAGALAFDVFYQTTTEPVFWFLLAIAWMSMPRWRPSVVRET
jgi:hypothetical protein